MSMNDGRDVIRNEIERWLESVHSTAAQLVASAGLAITTVNHARVHGSDDGSRQYTYSEDAVSPLASREGRQLLNTALEQCRPPANSIIRRINESFPGAMALLNPDKADGPAGWTDEEDAWKVLAGLARHYATESTAATEPPSETTTRECVEELFSLLDDRQLILLCSVPIDRTSVQLPIHADNVTIRELNPSELYRALEGKPSRSHWSMGEPAHEQSLVLEVRTPITERQYHSGADLDVPLQSTAVALELNNLRLSTRTWASFTLEPEWLTFYRRGVRAPFPQVTDVGDQIDNNAVSSALRLRENIPEESFSQPKTGLAAACYRFAVVTSRASDLDRLLDSVALLESIVVPGDARGELSYQVAMHGSWLLEPDDSEARLSLFPRLKDLYNKRSTVAHGSGPGRSKTYMNLLSSRINRLVERCA